MNNMKIRAWDREKKVYIYGIDFFSRKMPSNWKSFYDIEVELDLIGTQSEVYEGDIIEANLDYPHNQQVLGVVFYDDGEWCIEQDDDHFPVVSFHIINRSSIKVVGNKHEAI